MRSGDISVTILMSAGMIGVCNIENMYQERHRNWQDLEDFMRVYLTYKWVSISPSSILNPLILTWESALPVHSTSPVFV